MLDLVLKNGRVIDGTGNPWFFGDVGVKNGVIADIGRLTQKSEQTINVQCCVISPGFIDGHCHSDLMVLNNPRSEIKLRQEVTTEVLGNCGIAVAPSTNENLDLLPKATNTARHPKSVMPHKGGRRRRAGRRADGTTAPALVERDPPVEIIGRSKEAPPDGPAARVGQKSQPPQKRGQGLFPRHSRSSWHMRSQTCKKRYRTVTNVLPYLYAQSLNCGGS